MIRPEQGPSNIVFPTATDAGFGQLPFALDDSFRDDEEYLMPTYVALLRPGRRNCIACMLTAARHDLNSPTELLTIL